MKLKEINTVDYHYGEEAKLLALLYGSKEPILIKIKNFTDEFSLDYFEKNIDAETTYSMFENGQLMSIKTGNFAKIISEIKKNIPYRIFAQLLSRKESIEIENHVPLWQAIPFRPRYFSEALKVTYFFGGKDCRSKMHFDREHCCNLHLCLSGKKQFLLFTENQSENIYKLPFVGDSLIDFNESMEAISKKFPRINQAEGYNVLLGKGDMLFMPRNCWHYTTYLDASSAACYVFYPKKMRQFYGYFTGYFFWGYRDPSLFKQFELPIYQKISQCYAVSQGKRKFLYKIIEKMSYIILLPLVSLVTLISYKRKPRRVTY